jgi:urease accessory protein
MFADTCPSEPSGKSRLQHQHAVDPLSRVRVRGGVEIALSKQNGTTCLARARERDGYKVRVPKGHGALEVAIINTGGGIASGDEIAVTVSSGAGTAAVITAPAADRVYGASADTPARFAISMSLDQGASLYWLPQETILFDGARLERSIDVDMAQDAVLVLSEAVFFGRTARGERYLTGSLNDRWKIRREGKLLYAESTRLDGDIGELSARVSTLQDMRAVATVLLVGPICEPVLRRLSPVLDDLRSNELLLAGSTWNGILLVRMLARTGRELRSGLETLIPHVSGFSLPRVWNC